MRRPFQFVMLSTCCVLVFQGSSYAASVDVDAKACQEQMEMLLRLEVDCVVQLRPGAAALASAPQALQALIPGLACKAVVKFKKSQIYNEWVTEGQARLPDFPIACTVGAGQSDQFSALLRVECTRPNGAWSCVPALHDVKGLGFLGRVLENYVNNNDQLRSSLTKALTRQ